MASTTAGPSSSSEPHCFAAIDTHGVLTSTTNDLPGYRIVRTLGTVYGLTVRSRNWGADIGAVLKSVVGGELKFLTTMLYTSRDHAVERMIGECMGRGGNAVIGMRFDSGSIHVFSSVCAYGTAVVVEQL
jgi:uncharacterized protein YbjQ (UPF0145 family)